MAKKADLQKIQLKSPTFNLLSKVRNKSLSVNKNKEKGKAAKLVSLLKAKVEIFILKEK